MSRTATLAVLLSLGSTAFALEDVCDLRLELGGYTPLSVRDHRTSSAGSDSAIITDSTSDSTSDHTYDRGSFAIKFVYGRLYSAGGLLLSGGFAAYDALEDAYDPTRNRTYRLQREIGEFQFGIGYGVPVTWWSYFEAMADFSLGYMAAEGLDRSSSQGWRDIETGYGDEGGVGGHIGWFARPIRHLVLGVQVGVSHHAANVNNDFDTGASTYERLRMTLIDYRLTVGAHF